MTNTEQEAVREWVGGRVTLLAPIETMGESCAEMSLWVELPNLQVVGQMPADPDDPQASFGESLMRAMAAPLVGEARRPQRVRVADAALAEQLKRFSFLSVEVSPTPELDTVAHAISFSKASYLSDPSRTPKDFEQFFAAAHALWVARPWALTDDDVLVHVAVPIMSIEDGCVLIFGGRKDVRGFALFDSYDDYDQMAKSASTLKLGDMLPPNPALSVSFDPAKRVPESMRKEVAEYRWPLADENAYPILLHIVDGSCAPPSKRQLQLATVVMRAIASLATRHPEALQNYGAIEARESHCDEDGLGVLLTVPHPRSEQAIEASSLSRARTLGSTLNPYGIPLEPHQLEVLERTLGDFTMHRVVGLFCAVVSVPEQPRLSVWLGEIMRAMTVDDEAQVGTVMDLLMRVYSHVDTTIHIEGVDGLIPEPDDVDACRDWALGYGTILMGVDLAGMDDRVLSAASAILMLSEDPATHEALDVARGDRSREAMLEDFRESLANDVDFLLAAWSAARAKPPSRLPDSTFRREEPKVGRNDPCPCGSGKKYKKCCVTS